MFSGKQLKVLLEKVHYLIFWTMLLPTRPKIFLLSRKKTVFFAVNYHRQDLDEELNHVTLIYMKTSSGLSTKVSHKLTNHPYHAGVLGSENCLF